MNEAGGKSFWLWKTGTAKTIFEDYVKNVEKLGKPKGREILQRLAEFVGYEL